MTGSSVTGHGDGSVEGALRPFSSLDWFPKVRGINAAQIANGTITNQEFQYLNGLTGNIQQQINSGVSVPNVVTVNKSSSDVFGGSLYAAVQSITDSAESNRYVVRVGPGVYTEPEITIPPFVFIVGDHIDTVVVEPDATNHHVFTLGNRTGLVNLTVQNAGTGYAGINSYDIGSFALLHKVTIKNCDYGVYHRSTTEDSYLFLEYVDFTDCDKIIKVANLTSALASVNVENLYFEYLTANSANAIVVDGDNAELVGAVLNCIGIDTIGNAFLVTNGARLVLNSARIVGFHRGIYADTSGTNPYIKLSDIGFGQDIPNDIDVEIANTTATGYFDGYASHDKVAINKSNDFFVAGKDERTITVAKKGGDYASINDAINAIDDNDYSNRYNILVGPGEYTEDTITMKDYVTISGEETRSTIIQLTPGSPADTPLIINPATANATLRKVLLRNATGAAYKYEGGVVRLEQVRFGDNGLAVDGYDVAGAVQNSLDITNCSCARASDIPLLFKFADDGVHDLSVVISHFTTNDSADLMQNIAEIGIVSGGARGINTEVEFVGCSFIGDGTGTAIKVADGADIHIVACQVMDFDVGLHVPNEGNAPEIELVGSLIYDNTTYDVLVEHPTATGALSITSDQSKISVTDSVSVLIQDNTDGSLMVSGDFYQGATFSDITNMTEAMTKGPELGVSHGGGLSVNGLTVTVAAGGGYLHHTVAGTPHAQYIEWTETEVTIPANSNTSIYVDINGDVLTKAGTGTVDFFSEIFLGRAATDASSVILLVDNYRDAVASGTKYDKLFRLYLGPIFRSGCVVTSTDRNLNVSTGDYVVSTGIFQPTGGTPITFSTFYRNGSWYTITGGQTNVPNTHYDGGSGLVALQGTEHVKHALYTYGQGATEKYFLVYGQAAFASLEAAVAGAAPIAPSPMGVSVVCIAHIIMAKDGATVAQIIDQRPTLVTRSNAVVSTSIHGNLESLDANDHRQYLLVSGTGQDNNAMQGNLDMGTYQITNVGNVDGVDVSGHASRHLPNGADALTTDAPNANLSAVSTNEVGVQAKFARSDHWHAITAYSDGTPGGLVKLDGSGDFAAHEITANIIGNASGTAANVTGVVAVANGGTNSSTALNNDRIIISSGDKIVEASAITASRALASNASGIPVASATTAVELGYVSGVTSGIQAQLNGKQATGTYITALTGEVTATGPGSAAATIANNAVTNAKLAEMAANSIKGNNTGASATAADLTVTQATAMLNAMTGDAGAGGLKGLVPAQAIGDASKYLRGDGTWASPTAVVSYGELYLNAATATASCGNNTFAKASVFDTAGLSLNTTVSAANDSITVANTGVYEVTINGSISYTGNAVVMWVGVSVDAAQPATNARVRVANPGNNTIAGMNIHKTMLLSLSAGNVLTLMANGPAGAITVTYYTGTSLTVKQIA